MKDTTGVHVISDIVPFDDDRALDDFNDRLKNFVDTTYEDLDGAWSLAGPVQAVYVPDKGILYVATFRRDEEV